MSTSVGAGGASGSGASTVPGAEAFPAASVKTTSSSPPSSWAGSRSTLNVPSGSTVSSPITSPAALVTVTLVPGSPRPVRTIPLSLTARLAGDAGDWSSSSVTVAGSETLPAASCCTTFSSPPLFWVGSRLIVKPPLPATVPVPTITPLASRTVTVAPGSPRPVRIVPASLTSRDVGASGATRSGEAMIAGAESFPEVSSATTCRSRPSVWAGLSGILKLPVAPTVTVPTTTPSASVTVIFAPGSPRPVSTVPSSLILKLLGAEGPVRSGASVVPGRDVLPAVSVSVTSSVPPSVCAGASVTVNVPFGRTVAVPISSPAALVTVTAVPGSPRPVSVVPASLTSRLVGAAGSIRSGADVRPGCDVPLASLWTTRSSPPSIWAGASVTEKVPSLATIAVPTTWPAALVTLI
ncbi:hypothetical protein D3C71_499480 [compost metagenome]